MSVSDKAPEGVSQHARCELVQKRRSCLGRNNTRRGQLLGLHRPGGFAAGGCGTRTPRDQIQMMRWGSRRQVLGQKVPRQKTVGVAKEQGKVCGDAQGNECLFRGSSKATQRGTEKCKLAVSAVVASEREIWSFGVKKKLGRVEQIYGT